MSEDTTSFATILATRENPDGSTLADVTADWAQDRVTFGGLIGALLLRQMLREVDLDARPLRSLSMTFVAPLAPGQARCASEVLHAGKSTTLIGARITQGDALCCVGQASFAPDRPSAATVTARKAQPLKAASEIEPLPYMAGAMPVFLQHMRLYWAEGAVPFSGSPITALRGYCALDEAGNTPALCQIVALLDAWPTAAFAALSAPAAASTVSWTIDFFGSPAAPTAATPLQYESTIVAAHAGHVHAEAWLWEASGSALARATQLVALFG